MLIGVQNKKMKATKSLKLGQKNKITFNPAQQEVIDTLDGPVLVISCPGSGKTTVLVHRIKKLLENGIDPERILVTTFTNAASLDMTKRLKEIGVDYRVRTIHSLCLKIVKRKYPYYDSNCIFSETQVQMFFANYLRSEYRDFVKSASNLDEAVNEIISLISYAKNCDRDPKAFRNQITSCTEDMYVACYKAYEKEKKRLNKLDFDDCLLISRDVLKKDEESLKYWQSQFDYIMVDEYQDTNKVQADLFGLLAKEHRNICVVGDDDQAMYSFRGADSSIMLHFPKKFPDCKKILMDTNYRSMSTIVSHAEKLISNNKSRFDKNLKFAREGKAKIEINEYADQVEQAKEIVDRMIEDHKNGLSYSDMAVLFRTNAESAAIVQQLMTKEIPFYSNDTIKDPHASAMYLDFCRYYRIANGKGTSEDFMKVRNHPNRYLAANVFANVPCSKRYQLEACENANNVKAAKRNIMNFWDDIDRLKKAKDLGEFMHVIVDVMNYESCLPDLAKYSHQDEQVVTIQCDYLIDEAGKFDTMEQWMAHTEQFKSDFSKLKKSVDKKGVCLSTYHQAKGLEWDTVYLIDSVEGLTPHAKAESEMEQEEERRMYYVAFTRAKNHVCISIPEIVGNKKANYSRYIDELDFDESDIYVREEPEDEDIALLEKENGDINPHMFFHFLCQYFKDGEVTEKDMDDLYKLNGIMMSKEM